MCDPVTLGVLGGIAFAGGTAAKSIGESKALHAQRDALDTSKQNQQRLQTDNINTALSTAAQSAPGAVQATTTAPAAAPQDTSDLAQALAKSLPGDATTAGDARFAAGVGDSAAAYSGRVDQQSRIDELRRLYGLSQEDAMRALQASSRRIGANNQEARFANSLLPQDLDRAGQKGSALRMGGGLLQTLGKIGLTQGFAG